MIATPSPGVYVVGARFNIGGVTRNPPIRQISFPTNISGYTVFIAMVIVSSIVFTFVQS